MQILDRFRTSGLSGPLFLAIGVFDGVHLGPAVISTSSRHAGTGTPVVVTFDPHPPCCVRTRPLILTRHTQNLAHPISGATLVLLSMPVRRDGARGFVPMVAFRPLREICVGHEWSSAKARGIWLAETARRDLIRCGRRARELNGG